MKKILENNYKHMLFIVFIAVFVYSLGFDVKADDYSGKCSATSNDNVKWSLDMSTRVLTISGTGNMADFKEDVREETDEDGGKIAIITCCNEKWHKYSSKINKIVVKEGVTSIGEFAFLNCQNVTRVELPDSLESIGSYAFKNCKQMSEMTIPANVTYIGPYAFGDCRLMESMTIPDGVTVINQGMFKDCWGLTDIVLPDRLKKIDTGAFIKCKSLKNLTIPDCVESIGDLAFRDCEGLKSIQLPKSLKSINVQSFKNCTSLKKVEIPNGVEELYSGLFYNCTSLEYVYLPVTVGVIPSNAFDKCMSSLKIYGLNNYQKDYCEKYNLNYIDNSKKSGELKYTVCDNEAIIVGHTDGIVNAEIPEKISGYKVIGIWNDSFAFCYSLTRVSLPKTIEYIKDDAFKACFDLTEITNKSSISLAKGSKENGSIAESAANIRKKDTDKSIITEDSEGYIFAEMNQKNYLIGYSGKSQVLKLPNSYKDGNGNTIKNYHVNKYAFAGSDIKKCVLSSATTFIGNKAFYQCKNLTYVFIPASVNNIGSSALEECNKDLKVYGFSGTYAETYASKNNIPFKADKADVQVQLFDKMIKIEYNAVEWNSGKARRPKVTVMNGTTSLVQNKDFTVKYVNAKGIGEAKVKITGKGNYTGTVEKTYKIKLILNHKYHYGGYEVRFTKVNDTFTKGQLVITKNENTSAKKVVLGESMTIAGGKFDITGIGVSAFENCKKLKSITIGKNVSFIDNKAFYGCKNLTEMIVNSEKIKKVGDNSLRQTNAKLVIKVPKKLLKTYKNNFFNEKTGFEKTTKIKGI